MRRLAAPLIIALLAMAFVACDRVIDLTPSPDADFHPDAGPSGPDGLPDAGLGDADLSLDSHIDSGADAT